MISFIWNSRKCKLTYSDRKQISGCLGTRGGGTGRVGIDCKRAQGNFWGDGDVLRLTEMLVTWVYAFADAHWTGHLRRVHFIACELYLNKVFFLKGKKLFTRLPSSATLLIFFECLISSPFVGRNWIRFIFRFFSLFRPLGSSKIFSNSIVQINKHTLVIPWGSDG